MAWFRSRMWIQVTFLLITLSRLGLSDQLPEEKSYCTADSCDTDEEFIALGETDEEGGSDVRLAYSCVSPNLVPEEDAPVIFLHGMGDSKHTWNGLYQNIPLLTHRKACVYDARNHGDSTWNDELNIDALTEDLGRFIDKLKFERVVLVGHSMGGLTAINFALNNPSKVDRLLVEDISPIGIPKGAMEWVNGVYKVLEKSISVVPDGADENTAKNTIADYFREVTHQDFLEHFIQRLQVIQRDGRWQLKVNFQVIQKVLEEPEKALSVRSKGEYTGKALFIYGKLSPFDVDDHEEDIRKYFPNAEFFGVEGAGHDIHPGHREFTTQLIKFLE